MSDPTPTKSDSDLSTNSSWDVINESDDSAHYSLDNLCDEKKPDDQNITPEIYEDVIEDTFISIPEVEVELEAKAGTSDLRIFDESSDKEGFHQNKHGTKRRKSKVRGRKKSYAKSLSSLSIIASVLTLTGISLLCLFFPVANESKQFDELQKEYSKLSKMHIPNFGKNSSKIPEVFNLPEREEIFKSIHRVITDNGTLSDDEICTIEDEFDNITRFDQSPVYSLKNAKTHVIGPYKKSIDDDKIPRKDVHEETMNLISGLKKNLLNPRLHVLLCTVMKDIYLLKLIKELDVRQDNNKPNDGNVPKKNKKGSKKIENSIKIKKDITKKLKQKLLKKKANSTRMKINSKPTTYNTSFPSYSFENPQPYQFKAEPEKQPSIKFDNDNGKSECERRFQELDHRWESVGQSHRQKVQQIKEKFKNEMYQIRENEKEFPVRKERMKLIREIYIQRLKNDRERYLYHLTRLRDERHKIMSEICRKKKAILDSKDASVGNYAILLPGTYDFQQRLENMKNREYPKQLDVSSFVTSSFPSINSDHKNVFSANESSPSILESGGKVFSTNQAWKNYHKERMQNYYETKNKYLNKKAKKVSSLKEVVDTENAAAFDSLQESSPFVPIQITKSQDGPMTTALFNDTVIENIMTENGEHSASETEPLLEDRSVEVSRKRKSKKEMYDLLFDENGEKIKRAELTSLSHPKNQSLPQYQLFSRHDPKAVPKKIILFKGRL